LPQARALADQYIESCDQTIYRQEQAARQVAFRNQQLAEQQAEQTQRLAQQQAEQARQQQALHERELATCGGIGGRLQGDRCYSVVKGNPSGEPGADCVLPGGTPIWLSFTKDGEFLSGFYSTAKNDYPGCFK
jgi:hypothetical protein